MTSGGFSGAMGVVFRHNAPYSGLGTRQPMPSAKPPWMQEPADEDDGDDDGDELDPIGRNTLKLRSRAIVESIAVGASPPKLPPSNYTGQLSARGAGDNLFRSNAYGQQPSPGGFSAEAARFMPATPQPYHPQHPPPYPPQHPRPSAYPTAQQSSLGGGQHPPPLQQQPLPSMGQKRWEINDTMMHQSWGTHGVAPSSTLHALSASAPLTCCTLPAGAGTVLRTLNRS